MQLDATPMAWQLVLPLLQSRGKKNPRMASRLSLLCPSAVRRNERFNQKIYPTNDDSEAKYAL